MAGKVRFIRKGGKIIPIANVGAKAAGRTALKAVKGASLAVAGATVAKAVMQRKQNPKQKVKVDAGLDALGLGFSVASGAIGAATFNLGAKGFIGGMLGGHALDAAGIAANIASVKGKGHTKERIKQGARQEARNLIVGNAVYAAGLLAFKSNREKLVKVTSKIIEFGRKALVGA